MKFLDIFKAFITECIACAAFHFMGSMFPTPYGNGLALAITVFCAAPISGAHLNPLVTLVFMACGFTEPLTAIFMIIAQFVGCFFAALWLFILDSNQTGCFVVSDVPIGRLFLWELTGTLLFLFPLFKIVQFSHDKKGYGVTGPILIGTSLCTAALAVGQYTGGSFNPARLFGSTVIYNCANINVLGILFAGQIIATFITLLFIFPVYKAIPHWYTRHPISDIELNELIEAET
jgi:aquaporin Z